MKRFRFTLLAVCLVLLWLGWNDAGLTLRNPSPAPITIEELSKEGPPREWLHVTGGYQDLTEAISTSGSVEFDAFLVPLKPHPEAPGFKVLIETRNPRILDLLKTYYFKLDSEAAREKFLTEHHDEFYGRRDVEGTLITGLVATGNRDKLTTLARQLGMQVPEDVIFISEGKTPPRWRGFFYLAIGLLGLLKVLLMRRKPSPAAEG